MRRWIRQWSPAASRAGYFLQRCIPPNLADGNRKNGGNHPRPGHTFATVEVGSILKACDSFGKSAYERLRARAIVLTLRYTALRIGDVSLLARDRLNRDGDRWRIFLRTEKSGQPRVSACAPGFEGSSRLRYGATTQSSLAVSLLVTASVPKRRTKGILIAACGLCSGSLVCRARTLVASGTLATELLGCGASFEEVADILGNSPEIVRKHYGKCSIARQNRIDDLIERVYVGTAYAIPDKARLQ